MSHYYSTGEVAKACHITIRTVQYYDKNNIVSPSQISEGNRRMYSEEDIEKIKCVQLYKLLGFSLDEIKHIIQDCSLEEIIYYIQTQEMSTQNKILELQERQKHLQFIKTEIKENQKITIKNIENLNTMTSYRKKHKRVETITWILLIGYQIFLFTMFPLFMSMGGIYIAIILILTIAFLIFLIYYHSSTNAYICPSCHYKFTIHFLKDAFTLNNGKKGKVLRCPNCGTYTTMKETYIDK